MRAAPRRQAVGGRRLKLVDMTARFAPFPSGPMSDGWIAFYALTAVVSSDGIDLRIRRRHRVGRISTLAQSLGQSQSTFEGQVAIQRSLRPGRPTGDFWAMIEQMLPRNSRLGGRGTRALPDSSCTWRRTVFCWQGARVALAQPRADSASMGAAGAVLGRAWFERHVSPGRDAGSAVRNVRKVALTASSRGGGFILRLPVRGLTGMLRRRSGRRSLMVVKMPMSGP